MECKVTFVFDDMDITKYEMKKEMNNFSEYLADKYDADIYQLKVESAED